jgi:SAM-dependent methyltransferase
VLNGGEYFYEEWLEQLRAVVAEGPILDVGTPAPFNKELHAVQDTAGSPYLWVDFCRQAGGPTLVADASGLPVRSASARGVICSHVLQHVRSPALVIEEAWRVLEPGGRAYFTLLDAYPYHAGGEGYGDYHRFKEDAVDLLLGAWSAVHVLRGGGIGQVAMSYVPPKLKPAAQHVSNVVDRLVSTRTTPMRYVFATK